LVNRMEQVENRVSGTQDKVEELDQIVKKIWKNARKIWDIWYTIKIPTLWIMGIEGEEIMN
jgi:ferritin-like metal-binding protein YciE